MFARRLRWAGLGGLVALCLGGDPRPASAQGAPPGPCPYGRDPVTSRCLAKPISAPPPPPKLVLESTPAGARVYARTKEVPEGAQGCAAAGFGDLLGETPLTLTREKGLKAGRQSYCLEAEGYGVATVDVDVAPTGMSEPPAIAMLPFAKVVFDWDPKCPYPIAPEVVTVQRAGAPRWLKGLGPTKRPFPAEGDPLPAGAYTYILGAEGFAERSFPVLVDKPGSPDKHVPVCLDPTREIGVVSPPDKHPLDGLFLRVTRADGREIYRGPAPGRDAVKIRLRPTDEPVFAVYADPAFARRVPEARVGAQRDFERKGVYIRWIDLEEKDVKDDKRHREAVRKACFGESGGDGGYCASEAYLLVHADGKKPDDGDVLKALQTGCRRQDARSCAALGSDEPLVPGNPFAPISRQTILEGACRNGPADVAWLACMRLQQPSLPGSAFLTFAGAPALSKERASVNIDFRLFGGATLEARPGAVLWSSLAIRGFPVPWFGVGGALRLTDVAVLPAATSRGEPRGYRALAGVGLEFLVALRPARWFDLDLSAFTSGYYTASASAAGGYAGATFNIPGPASDRTPSYFHLTALAGLARFPRVVATGVEEREALGGVVRGFAGLTFAWGGQPEM